MMRMTDLDQLFKPSSIAFVGLSDNGANWASRMMPSALLDMGFAGKLYLVSRNITECRGIKTYRDRKSVV